MKHIYITRTIPEAGLKLLRDKGYELDIRTKDSIPSKRELIKALKKKPYDALVSLLTDTIDADIFNVCPTLKAVANYAVGFNNIDIAEAQKRNIAVSNTQVSSDNVAEHTIALIFALTTRLVEGDRYIRKGKYTGWSPSLLVGTDLFGKTLGLIGTGRIGDRVAEHAYKGFGVKIIYHDLNQNTHIEQECDAVRKNSVEEVLKEADIVSLHVPLLPSTKHLINEKTLGMMKKTAFLINTSRGPVVDEIALCKALQNKQIAGAGLDVFEFEPKITKGLLKLDNVVLTPHIASARESARNEMAELAAKNLISFFETGAVLTPAK